MIKLVKMMSFSQKQKPLPKIAMGRWNLLSCDISLERRVDLANIDHCGPCSYEELPLVKSVSRRVPGN